MIAYVSTQLIVLPLLNLAGLGTYLSYLDQNAWLAGLFTESHRNFSSFINNHIIY